MLLESHQVFDLITHILFIGVLAYYTLTNLQWYSYKIQRVVFHHYKLQWHLLYFVLPIVLYFLLNDFFYFYFYIAYIPSIILWTLRLDKKLKFTGRVYRFIAILATLTLIGDALCFFKFECDYYPVLLPMIFTYIISSLNEHILLKKYAEAASEKLASLHKLRIICITGSYGKTSLKNFTHQLIKDSFRVYSTPRSINTYAGIVADINDGLPEDAEIYIAEAGARVKGDIAQIAELLNHDYALIGKIGAQHIEYFKTLQNIIETKLEILHSAKLKKALYYKENQAKIEDPRILNYPEEIRNIESTLDGLSFEIKLDGEFHKFHCGILGAFNAINISGAICMAKELGVEIETIKRRVANLKPVEHRLCKMEARQKTIIDDSFNGNLEGMLEGIRLASLHKGRKVIVTPGIVESDDESNLRLAKAINEVFDIAIITGGRNMNLLKNNIARPQKIILKEKSNMQNVLQAATKEGDLILFANDAPSYV